MIFKLPSMSVHVLLVTCVFSSVLHAPDAIAQTSGYRLPPKAVVDIVDAPRPPVEFISPDRKSLLIAEDDATRSLADLAKPFMKFAGMRVHPGSNSQVKYRFYRRPYLIRLPGQLRQELSLPAEARFGIPVWSYDGRYVVLPSYTEKGVALWVVDARSGHTRRLKDIQLNATLSEGYRQIDEEHVINMAWTPDNQHVLAPLVISGRGRAPDDGSIPAGPVEYETEGNFSRERNWEDLSLTPHDEALFEYYSTSQLFEINVLTGKREAVGQPGLFIAPPLVSPDGKFMLVQRVKRPYSHWVRYREFSRSVEIWDRRGNLVRVLADLPSRDHVAAGAKSRELAGFQWQPGRPATLVWIEHGPEGSAGGHSGDKSQLLRLSGPFGGSPEVLGRAQADFERVDWLEGGDQALVTETSGSRQWKKSTTRLASVGQPAETWPRIFEYIVGDMAEDPGLPAVEFTARGERLVRQDGPWIYLSGMAESPEGEDPFLDKLNVRTGERTRMFRSRPGSYERFLGFAPDSPGEILISHESRLEPRGLRRFNLLTGQEFVLLQPPNPYPQFQGITRRLVTYPRNDGVGLSGTLYLPDDHKAGTRLPLVIWAYPTEYSDRRVASQIRVSANHFMDLQFTNQQAFRQFVTQGYAVLDMAEMPVVGDPKTRNDTYREQIVGSARAAIEYLDSQGIIDPRRVGIGGHSYGGFSVAHQLANSKLFSAGISTSGSFNRTLDPWGFHAEPRSLWQAPERYIELSPLLKADRISAPLLLVHGEADDSQSSKTIHSYRMFHALRGLGATAKLVLLPLENHHYSARESRLHVAAEMIEWFDTHLKAKPSE